MTTRFKGDARGDSVLTSFDRSVDSAFDHLRGHPTADRVAAILSNLSDHGFVWSVVAATKGRRRGPARRMAVRALAVAGFSSLGINAGIKALVQRSRPEVPHDELAVASPLVRTPTSSSFPSGHTLASFCTAVMLAEGPFEMTAFITFAAAVAASRVHLRAHHPSDVVGGAGIGLALGAVGRRLLRERPGS